MSEQQSLFLIPKPTSKEIRELVKHELYGFRFRQAARDQKREQTNAHNRARTGKLARKGGSSGA